MLPKIRIGASLLALAFRCHAATTAPEASASIGKYCATCHSAKLKTAGLALDPAGAAHVATDPEVWEKVVAKLRSTSMPPPGAPRPDNASYAALRAYFETELDRAAAAKPIAGKTPALHRLSRTEYANAVRDVFDLGPVPKEMDYSLLLPQDNAMSGFDNLADLLFVSPTAMESYLGAAEKIARLAVGDPATPPIVNIFQMPDEKRQNSRLEELPVGTRGGLAVRSEFPLNGEYVVKVEFAGASSEEQKLEITVDGERMELAAVKPSPRRFPGGGGDAIIIPGMTRPTEFRIHVKAGPHLVGVSFVERNEVRDEETLRPRYRSVGPEMGLDKVTIAGPYNAAGPGDTPSRRRIFVCRPAAEAEEGLCARKIFLALARRAYRRPSNEADVEGLMPFFRSGRTEGGFERGVEFAIQRMLVSPQFLFRIERDPAGMAPGTAHPVSDLELASRLSFFLWSSVPDEELLTAATSGRLRQAGELEKQVHRMMADARSATLSTNFAEQWLYLRDLDSRRPNEVLFADFDESLRDAFRRETDLFVDSVLRGGGSVMELLSANYTFVNERLAKHYGIPNVHGSDYRKVTFAPGSPRGGLLGQGSILTITSYANRTSPVNRGKWVLENLLAAAPPPPPANVPALKTEAAATGKPLAMRDAMVQHRANPACFGCHARMDPIGFAMENFDAIGRWRDRDGENSIDTAGVFPNGEKFEGMAGLKATLLAHPEDFVTTVTRKLLMYATGRNAQYFDEPAIRAIARDGAKKNYTFESLVLGVAKSVPFRMREVPAPHTGADARAGF